MNLKITGFSCEEIKFSEPIDFFEQYSSLYYSTLFTGKGPADISGYSYAGLYPYLIIRYRDGVFETENEYGINKFNGEFWKVFKNLFNEINFSEYEFPVNMCGPMGYLSYEGYHTVENINSLTEVSYSMPVFEMVLYNRYLFFDSAKKKSYVINILYPDKSFIDKKKKFTGDGISVANLKAECSREEYKNKVKRIIDYIIEGDVYEVCLTQEFRADFKGNPFEIFRNLFLNNPAPFSAYLNFRDVTVLCNSPELFIRCREKIVETRPIKGTAPRGRDILIDEENRNKLLRSTKEEAELSMIIDLLRNDIGKVCKRGSVKVADSKRIEAYENVFQLIGIVRGELEDDSNYVDLLKAVFPGGSITGCPKVRSMEIIEELEKYKRNIYTGTIFIFNKNFFESNIVIRTAVISEDKIFFNSGGAVTVDSTPQEEYDEIIHKIKNIMRVIGCGGEIGEF